MSTYIHKTSPSCTLTICVLYCMGIILQVSKCATKDFPSAILCVWTCLHMIIRRQLQYPGITHSQQYVWDRRRHSFPVSLWKVRKHFPETHTTPPADGSSHLIGHNCITCPGLNQSLAREMGLSTSEFTFLLVKWKRGTLAGTVNNVKLIATSSLTGNWAHPTEVT